MEIHHVPNQIHQIPTPPPSINLSCATVSCISVPPSTNTLRPETWGFFHCPRSLYAIIPQALLILKPKKLSLYPLPLHESNQPLSFCLNYCNSIPTGIPSSIRIHSARYAWHIQVCNKHLTQADAWICQHVFYSCKPNHVTHQTWPSHWHPIALFKICNVTSTVYTLPSTQAALRGSPPHLPLSSV